MFVNIDLIVHENLKMSLIKNLVKEDKKPNKKKEEVDEEEEQEKPVVRQIKSATELQRFKLEKLMKNPEKPIEIPAGRHEKDYMKTVPDFVRNVMGSSAGAGSGEFHVYRHLRRKEYSRQKIIEAQSQREQLDQDYRNKLDENKRKAEERTAKKRAKRLKRKAKKPHTQNNDKKQQDTNVEEESSEEEQENDVKSNEKEETEPEVKQEKPEEAQVEDKPQKDATDPATNAEDSGSENAKE